MKKIELLIEIYYARFEKILQYLPLRLGPLLMLLYRQPLNGQRRRRELFEELFTLAFDAVVETGMFIGSSTAFFGRACGARVYAVERNPLYYRFARLRLRRAANVHAFHDDSRKFLQGIRDNAAFPKKNVLFYLDAHGSRDVPLSEEVAIITRSWSEFVIVIDDFKVPGDTGYHFDRCGASCAYELGCFYFQKIGTVALFSPSAPSGSENGFKRGCILLASKDSMLPKIARLEVVRPYTAP